MAFEKTPYWYQFLFLLLLISGAALLVAGVQYVVCLFLGIDLELLLGEDYSLLQEYLFEFKLLQILSSSILFILPAVVFARLVRGNWVNGLRIDRPTQLLPLVYIPLLVLFIWPLVLVSAYTNQLLVLPEWLSAVEVWMQQLEQSSTEMTEIIIQADNVGALLLNLIMIAVVPALGEELFFRGAMQSTLVKWIRKPHVAIILTSFIFSFFHFQFYGFLPRWILGIFLGYLFYFSGNLWYSIIAHFLVNGFQVIIAYALGTIATDSSGSIDLATILLTLGATCLFGLFGYLYFSYFKQKRDVRTLTIEREDRTLENWVKILSSRYLHKVEIAKGVLEEQGITSVVLNKQDTAYHYGEIELYTTKEFALKATNIIKTIKYE